jgi:hypothetical protein
MNSRGRFVFLVASAALSVGILACVDHVVGPTQDVPLAASYPAIPSSYNVQAATSTDSRVPSITVVGDSVLVSVVVPTICGRDTVMAGAARDTVVMTLRRTLLPLPCAILLPDVRLRAAAVAPSSPRVVVLSVETRDFRDTTRAIVASAAVGVATLSR